MSGIGRKALRGALALGGRQVAVQGMNVLGGILLARLLTPAEFGLLAVSYFVLGLAMALADPGLSASLVRQRMDPPEEDYRAVFSLQQGLAFGLGAFVWAMSGWAARFYGRPPSDAWLFRLVGLAAFLASFQPVPTVRLERRLRFGKLALVELSQALAFNGVAVALAFRGLGSLSLGLGLLARAATGAILANAASPWRMGWHWSTARVAPHARFGLLFQGSVLASIVKDGVTPVLAGLAAGVAEVGYIHWAQMVAAYPVLALMVFQRVYLPAFSRLQDDRRALEEFLKQVLRLTNALVAPLALVTLALIEPITDLVFGVRWRAALPIFTLLWAANLFVPTVTPILSLLNALGRSRTTLFYSLVWMAGTWLAGFPLILRYGGIGYGMANLAVQATNVALFRTARAHVSFRALPLVLPAWVWAGLVGGATHLVARARPPQSLWVLGAYGIAGLLVYAGGCYAVNPARARGLVNSLRGLE